MRNERPRHDEDWNDFLRRMAWRRAQPVRRALADAIIVAAKQRVSGGRKR